MQLVELICKAGESLSCADTGYIKINIFPTLEHADMILAFFNVLVVVYNRTGSYVWILFLTCLNTETTLLIIHIYISNNRLPVVDK